MSDSEVLVVDDDDDIRDVMQEVLLSEGFRVDVAKDGLDALGKLEESQEGTDKTLPVILLDMMMPNMDGEAFIKALRSKPAVAGAAVVIISGNAAAREMARKLEAAACLVKPFELVELLAVLRRLTSPGKH